MKVRLYAETGYIAAMFGIGLSYGLTSDCDTIGEFCTNEELINKIHTVAVTLSKKGGGEDKFLRQLGVIFDITAPMYWWFQLDTYKVGTVSQSESKMHSLTKKPFTLNDFAYEESDTDLFGNSKEGFYDYIIKRLNKYRDIYLQTKNSTVWKRILEILPQSYQQRRIWSANYAVLKNIFDNRANHRLKEWHDFIQQVRLQLAYQEFLPCSKNL